jgi:hypothetical protein
MAIPDWAVPVQQEPEKPANIPEWAVPVQQNYKTTPEITTERPPPSISQGVPAWKHDFAEIARPTLEMVGMLGGAVAGAGAGPKGSIGGAAIGYAAASNMADRVSEWLGIQEPMSFTDQAIKIGKDIPTGAAYEAGGLIISKGFGVAANAIGKQLKEFATSAALTQESAKRKAGKVLIDRTSSGAQYEKNAEEALALQERIGGVKFTRGQLTNDPQAVSFEASRARMPGQQSADLLEQRAMGQQATREFAERELGGGNVADFVGGVANYESRLKQTVLNAQGGVNALAAKMGSGQSQIKAGSTIVEQVKAAKNVKRLRAGELYDLIPNVKLKSDKLDAAINGVNKEFVPGATRAEDFPAERLSDMRLLITDAAPPSKILGPNGMPIQKAPGLKDIKFSELRELRSSVQEEIRRATSGANPNGKLARRLNTLLDAIEETLETTKYIPGEPGKLYRQASDFYNKEYVQIFKQGSIKDVLIKDATGAAKVRNSQVASRFFQPGPLGSEVADDFLRAVGNDQQAMSAIKDALSHEAIGTITDASGNIVPKKLNQFLKQYGPALKKYGLDGEIKTLQQAQKLVDDAVETVSLFNHSAASRILKASPDTVVSEAFKGADMVNPAKTTADLMKLVSGNQAAENGLKTAIVNHIMKSAETNGADFAGNAIMSQAAMKKAVAKYAPVLRTIYKNEPEKIKAMMDVRKSLEVLARNERSPVGGGSDTAANIAYQSSRVVGPAIFQRYAMNNAFQLVGKMIGSVGEGRVNVMLNRAAVDPEMAYQLMALARGTVTPQRFEKMMAGHITALSLYSVKETAEELMKEPEGE